MEQHSKPSLALFDFDGTLTTKDSLLDFLLYVYGWKKLLVAAFFLAPTLVSYALKLIPNDVAKRKVIRFFFAGEPYQLLKVKGNQYGETKLPDILESTMLDKLRSHKNQGHRVVVVSASSEIWLEAWTLSEQVELIGTQYQVVDGVLTGDYDGLNCHGVEKVRRIEEKVALDHYDQIYAYGDSKGDLPMLGLASHRYMKTFFNKWKKI